MWLICRLKTKTSLLTWSPTVLVIEGFQSHGIPVFRMFTFIGVCRIHLQAQLVYLKKYRLHIKLSGLSEQGHYHCLGSKPSNAHMHSYQILYEDFSSSIFCVITAKHWMCELGWVSPDTLFTYASTSFFIKHISFTMLNLKHWLQIPIKTYRQFSKQKSTKFLRQTCAILV